MKLPLELPYINSNFRCVGLRPELYLLDWVMTIFGKAVPLDLACRFNTPLNIILKLDSKIFYSWSGSWSIWKAKSGSVYGTQVFFFSSF
jgi:hypothetical protein